MPITVPTRNPILLRALPAEPCVMRPPVYCCSRRKRLWKYKKPGTVPKKDDPLVPFLAETRILSAGNREGPSGDRSYLVEISGEKRDPTGKGTDASDKAAEATARASGSSEIRRAVTTPPGSGAEPGGEEPQSRIRPSTSARLSEQPSMRSRSSCSRKRPWRVDSSRTRREAAPAVLAAIWGLRPSSFFSARLNRA